VIEIIVDAAFFDVAAPVPREDYPATAFVRGVCEMKKLALGALVVGLSAACGGGGGGGVKLLDASIDAQVVCNPSAGTGCATGEKCTWIVDAKGTDRNNDIGHTGCTAVGTKALGAACSETTLADGSFSDDCGAEAMCISSVCKPICDLDAVSGTGACATNFSCAAYGGVFVSGTSATAGVCEPGCDPITQRLLVGDFEACGSQDPTQPDFTCVPSRGFGSFHCAPSGTLVYANVGGKEPLADSQGNFFANGCAPGFIPFYPQDADAGTNTIVCAGLCAAVTVDSTIAGADNPDKINQGDKTVAGKLLADAAPVIGHATCGVGIKGTELDEDCRFIWSGLEQDPTQAVRTPYSDTLGACLPYSKFVFTNDAPPPAVLVLPSCAKLPKTAPKDDFFGSAAAQGCYSLTDALALPPPTALRRRPHGLAGYRPAYGPAPMARHIFD
jgi:hypothetical protein